MGASPAGAPGPGAPAPPRLLVIGGVVHGYTWRLLRELARLGVEVRAVHRDAPARMAAQFAHETGPEGDLPALDADRASFREAVAFARAPDATAILALGGSGNLPLLLAACALKRRGTPVVLFTDANVPAGPVGAPRDWARHVLYRALRPLLAEAWTLGGSNEDALRRFGVDAQRRLPLYATDFRALASAAAPARPPGAALRLLCIARLSPEKNHRALLEALRGAAPGRRLELTLVGEGPERPALEALARASPVPVRLLGAVPRARMAGVFADADALVLASTREPWGIVVVEALGLGLPVVATTRVGSAVSLAGLGGIVLADDPTPGALRAALAALAGGHEALRAAARAASAHVREAYGTEPVAARIAAALRQETGRAAAASPAR